MRASAQQEEHNLVHLHTLIRVRAINDWNMHKVASIKLKTRIVLNEVTIDDRSVADLSTVCSISMCLQCTLVPRDLRCVDGRVQCRKWNLAKTLQSVYSICAVGGIDKSVVLTFIQPSCKRRL